MSQNDSQTHHHNNNVETKTTLQTPPLSSKPHPILTLQLKESQDSIFPSNSNTLFAKTMTSTNSTSTETPTIHQLPLCSINLHLHTNNALFISSVNCYFPFSSPHSNPTTFSSPSHYSNLLIPLFIPPYPIPLTHLQTTSPTSPLFYQTTSSLSPTPFTRLCFTKPLHQLPSNQPSSSRNCPSPFSSTVPPAIHQYLGNGAFPQQPQASTVYPPPSAVAANGMKYPLPQYKPGTNAANSAHYVMPAAYGAYGSSPSGGYNPNSAETAGNSTSSEDLGSSQFKENNVYLNGQQSEGSAMWVAASGRDISSMPASSFYNLPPQGQHVTFAPTQAGHGNFAGVYHHPAQAGTAGTVHPLLQQSQTMAGAVDMVGPGGNVYQQQPQHAHINWPSNY